MKTHLIALAALFLASGAVADVLVTRDGERVETRDAWEVKGRLVVFHLPDGTLSSLRLDNVDLEASDAATAEKANPPQAQDAPAAREESRRKATIVIRDGDVARVGEAPTARDGDSEENADLDSAAEAGSEAPPAPTPAENDGSVQVTSWDSSSDNEGSTVAGTITNTGTNFAISLAMVVRILDADGSPIAQRSVTPRQTALPAGRATTFSTRFPGVYDLPQVEFDLQWDGYEGGLRSPGSEESPPDRTR